MTKVRNTGLPTGKNGQDFVPYNQWLHQYDDDIRREFPERSAADLADKYDVSYYTVVRRAGRLGVGKAAGFMRTRWAKGGKAGKGNRNVKRDKSHDSYLTAHFHDTSNVELAQVLCVDVKTVRRWARRLGLQKSEAFMLKARSRGSSSKAYYTDEHLAWRNKRIAEVYRDAGDEQMKQLMAELGISHRTLKCLAYKIGVNRSPERVAEAKRRGWDKSRKYGPEVLAAIAEYHHNHSDKECAEKFGISEGVIGQLSVKNGWKKDKEYVSRLRSELSRRRHQARKKEREKENRANVNENS